MFLRFFLRVVMGCVAFTCLPSFIYPQTLGTQPLPTSNPQSLDVATSSLDQARYQETLKLVQQELASGTLDATRAAELKSKILFMQANVALNEQKHEEALKVIEGALQSPTLVNQALFWQLKGKIFFVQKKNEQARDSFLKAIQIDPDQKLNRFYLGEIAFNRGKWLEASQYYTEFLNSTRERREALLKLIYCKVALRQLGQAKRLLNELDVFDENHPGYYFAKAAIFRAQGQAGEAQLLLDQVQTIYGMTTFGRYQEDYYALVKLNAPVEEDPAMRRPAQTASPKSPVSSPQKNEILQTLSTVPQVRRPETIGPRPGQP